MLVPLYGFLEGDTIGLLLLARAETTIADLAARLKTSAEVRVADPGPVCVLHAGRELAPHLTVAQAGLQALDRVDVRRARAAAGTATRRRPR